MYAFFEDIGHRFIQNIVGIAENQWTHVYTFFEELKRQFVQNIIAENRWKHILSGLGITLEVTFFALIIGLVLGCIIALIRSTHDKLGSKKGFLHGLLAFANRLCNIYLTVIRGTPVLIQLMIIYFIIFASSSDKVLAAIIAFGLNSAAYVAEIVRSGIMSIDNGQFEAGRSLGFGHMKTMWYIIVPQAFKNVLPALANEFIVLIKETSVSSIIGLGDLSYAGNLIRSRTYEAFFPLIAVALIYLALVMLLSRGVKCLERRLRAGER